MKRILIPFFALAIVVNAKAQVTAKDCTAAVNVCTNNSFSVSPAGSGFIDFTTSSNISNPTGNPAGIVPTGGFGCLKAGELNPTWMIINIQTPGTLEFSMGAGTGPGAQSGCYDWSMWPYNPATACSGINGNTLAPIRCCWNSMCSGGTGLASAANLPAGGSSKDFGAPINCNCGDKFIMCFSNYSSVNTLVPLNFFGTAIVSCSPISSTLSINSASICPGGVATLSVSTSPGTTYTWAPGGQTAASITVSPSSSTTYTLFAANACGSFSGTTNVFVSPAMNISFANTNGSCFPAAYGSSTVNVTGGTGPYTYSWSVGGTGTSVSGLTTGTYSLTATDALGCKSTATTTITAPAPFSFSLSASTPSLLTCTNSVVTISASTSSTLSNITYTWTTPSGTAVSSSYNATQAGVYTVVGGDQTVGSCTDTQTLSITQDLTAPSVTVSPISQTIACNGGCKTFTATSTSTTNIVGTWFDPSSTPVVGPSGTPLILCANAPGTYTATFVNLITGCATSQTVSVSASTVVPSITITPVSSNGFTINCTHPNVQMVINSSSTLAPTSYSWTNLTTNVSTSPPAGGYTVTVPGQYEAAFKDGGGCKVTTTVTIYIDTLRPSPASITNLPSNSYTLNCSPNSSLMATAITSPTLPVTNYSWTVPPNLTMFTNTVAVSLSNITSSTAPTAYTVIAMGLNGCIGKQKVNFYKDVYLPPYSIVFTPTAITCSNPCVALTGVSSASTPASYTFVSSPPTQTATTAGALMCSTGTYTMNYTNLLNGCTGSTTNIVALNTTPPGTVALAPVSLPCGQTTTTISAGTTTTSTTYSYNWAGPPMAGFSCAGGVGCNTTQVSVIGNYFVAITNTVNGCRSTNEIVVTQGSINASFSAEPISGYSPLSVNFDNTTALGSITSGSVYTTWNYGNGTSTTVTGPSLSYSVAGAPDGNAYYQSAGSYTVYLIVSQQPGTISSCVSTASLVVNIELPSNLAVPNVFTPNGDGVNDDFILQTTNLTDITFLVFDRWGVKMYDIPATDKGNISWDGKNLSNKDVPAGTYFYIVKAKGKDGKEFEQKGTISLYR
jgi:gliding motility-associated-like protein